MLSRLTHANFEPTPAASNADLDDVQLQDDLDKLRRSGFIQ